VDWRIAGAYFEACNCEAICPCRKIGDVPGGRSTYGECLGVLGWRIDAGHADGVDLTGLHAALICRYHDDEPGSPWTIRLHVDERGSPAARAAIEAILLGRAGGPHILKLPWVRKPSELLDVVSSPIELRSGRPHELRVGDAARLRATRTVEAQPPVACGIPGYERGGTEYYADENAVDDLPYGWDFVGRCAFAGDFDYVSS
jgi:hypothetical protein